MSDHRIRLSTEDTALIVSALRARVAMTTGMRRHRIDRLATRLAECERGNPRFSLGEYDQAHQEALEDEE